MMSPVMNSPSKHAGPYKAREMADSFAFKGVDICAGSKQLVTGAEMSVGRSDRIFLLGRNGCGKSTLFNWLASTVSTETSWTAYCVAQELAPVATPVISVVLGAHLERGSLWRRQGELEELEEMSAEETAEYRAIGERLVAMKADADEPRARRILAGLGFSLADMDRPLTEFSGGWRSRVALAQGLFMEPDLLLLDEPTNHLDLDGVIWLTDFLSKWRKTVIVISHNRGFIDGTANSIWEIRQGRLRIYRCRYSRFLQQRVLEDKKAEEDWAALEKEVKALRKKGTPAANKAATDLAAKRLAEGVCRPEKAYAPKFFFAPVAASRDGLLISATGATLGYGDRVVLRGVDFAIHQGCRVAVLGANGSGKSTLVRFLSGELAAQNEDVAVSRRPGLRIAAFDQHFYHHLPEGVTPLEYLRSIRGDEAACRRFLGASGLDGSTQSLPIGSLSGGQKARVYFAGLALQEPDVLLMDEPTNHLDMETVEGLTAGLQEFGGAAVIISHDVDFLSEVATEVWVTEAGAVRPLGEGTDGLDIYVDSVLAAMAE
jgi:ATPase subunit of ABC transporter with duplicated ATPase domains